MRFAGGHVRAARASRMLIGLMARSENTAAHGGTRAKTATGKRGASSAASTSSKRSGNAAARSKRSGNTAKRSGAGKHAAHSTTAARSRTARPARAAATKSARRTRRTSTRAAASTAQQSASASAQRRRHFLAFIGVLAFLVTFCFALTVTATYQNTNAKYEAVEGYEAIIAQACDDCGLGSEWTDAVLAIMYIESGGDADVESVLGVEHDVMQAAEGAYGSIVTDGSSEYGVEAETVEASIYAGVLEFKDSLELWEGYLGTIEPEDTAAVQLVVQGYNFGAAGWFAWCEEAGVTAYTVELAETYSDEEMPEDAKGTPTHAEKWLEAYERIVADGQ